MITLLNETTVSGTATTVVDVTNLSQNYHTLRVIVTVPILASVTASRKVGIHPIMSDGKIINGSGTAAAFNNDPVLISNYADANSQNYGLNVGPTDNSTSSWGNFAINDFHMYSINARNAGTANTGTQGRRTTGFGSNGNDPWCGIRPFTPRTNLALTTPADVTVTGIRLAIIDDWTAKLPENTKILIYGVGNLAV